MKNRQAYIFFGVVTTLGAIGQTLLIDDPAQKLKAIQTTANTTTAVGRIANFCAIPEARVIEMAKFGEAVTTRQGRPATHEQILAVVDAILANPGPQHIRGDQGACIEAFHGLAPAAKY